MSLSHHRLLPAAAPPLGDPYYVYAPHPHSDPQRQGVVTLFVAGLPDDVKPREIHNLFSRRPGFDQCLLEYTGRGNQGTVFDPENGDCLHIELAKSNSRRRHGGGGDVYRVIDKRVNRREVNADNEHIGDDDVSGEDEGEGKYGEGGSDEPSDTENDNSSDKNELPADQSGEPGIKQKKRQSPSNDQPDKSSVDIPPCSTLFIENLGQTCTEEELEEVFSKQPGFHVLKMRRRGGMPAAFADFTDIESSTAAMNNLQGTILSSSDSDGLRIEYARSKMRKS
ncbi:hypothetical protein BRADI_1g49340v3 [Brachypodium distachyon]|uniref:RRM domain-containing protein n=1 Tax=Brachypodium distachyon TaxID=15368 RepID=A0A2K2DQK0_BRADI|nr:hypothetical protein BRADI_1g49340v3 [Brachypodium distachyon]